MRRTFAITASLVALAATASAALGPMTEIPSTGAPMEPEALVSIAREFAERSHTSALGIEHIDFEGFASGCIHGQQGWSNYGAAPCYPPQRECTAEGYDHWVVSNTGAPYSYADFGATSFRMSSAVTSGCFGGHAFSKSIANEAGEAGAGNDGMSGGQRQRVFLAQWQFGSTVPGAQQPGLAVVASPDRGDGARMSWVRMSDQADGLAVDFFDYQSGANEVGCVTGSNFVSAPVASGLDRTQAHTLTMAMALLEGAKNDLVVVLVDLKAVHVGTSWEDYFRECEGNPTRTVDSLLFRTGAGCSGLCNPALLGKGFVIDNVYMASVVPTL